jgi:hypothetical protein
MQVPERRCVGCCRDAATIAQHARQVRAVLARDFAFSKLLWSWCSFESNPALTNRLPCSTEASAASRSVAACALRTYAHPPRLNASLTTSAEDGLEAVAEAQRLKPDVVLRDIQNLAFDDLEVTISKVCVRVAFLELAFKSCSVDVFARNISLDQALPDMRGRCPNEDVIDNRNIFAISTSVCVARVWAESWIALFPASQRCFQEFSNRVPIRSCKNGKSKVAESCTRWRNQLPTFWCAAIP